MKTEQQIKEEIIYQNELLMSHANRIEYYKIKSYIKALEWVLKS